MGIVLCCFMMIAPITFLWWQLHNKELYRKHEAEAMASRNQDLYLRNRRLQQLVEIDDLTGILNYRGFKRNFEREWRRAQRNNQHLSVVICDIDNFKQVNDLLGHPEANRCLQRVAHVLTRSLSRPGDIIARYGGDEFIAILPNTDELGALCVGERFRLAVVFACGLSFTELASNILTLSVGTATVKPGSGQPEKLIKSADEALLQAKMCGRNRVLHAAVFEKTACRTNQDLRSASG